MTSPEAGCPRIFSPGWSAMSVMRIGAANTW
jgi:hypothetical protein